MNIEGMNEDLWTDLDCEEVKAVEEKVGPSCSDGVCTHYCGCNCNFNCGCNGGNT